MGIVQKHWSLFFWAAALLALFFANPQSSFTLCPLKLAGLDFCPGCGIGRAIHYALHGHWSQSLKSHWFGIPATGIFIWSILGQIISLYQNKQT